jgi:long-subunit acyl-CoA synthetase (AMP-forming)
MPSTCLLLLTLSCNVRQACNRMSYVCVPLYETLGEDAIEYIIEHSEARLVVVAGKRLGRMAAALRQVGKLAGVVYWGEAAPADIRVSMPTAWLHACRTGQTAGAAAGLAVQQRRQHLQDSIMVWLEQWHMQM